LNRPGSGNANSFGTFLEYVNAHEPDRAGTSGAPLKLLQTLAASGPLPVADLLSASQMRITDFTNLLSSMKDVGLVTLAGAPGPETVSLTASGELAARMAG
jgi:hypothetical protein